MVNKGEDQEQNLYNKVRNAEYSRQKQEQTVRRLQQQLGEVRRKNAATMTKEIAERNRQEMELEQLLLREKAELDKVGNGLFTYKTCHFPSIICIVGINDVRYTIMSSVCFFTGKQTQKHSLKPIKTILSGDFDVVVRFSVVT